jgi:site-specific DNA-methyltransferase (adenine-specific)
MSFTLHHGDCLEVMAGMEAGSVDAVVTDPPYGLEFMGMSWDKLDWRDGGGMSKCGLGDRATEWVSYGGETANATCAVCGGRMRGANKCNCESPEWRVKGEAYHSRNAHRAAMMQEWHQAWATEALRVLKPSHYLLAFGGTRTWHRLACALEDAGFEIRDTIMWLYGTGFPKGDANLKPAWEPIILARKPGRKRALGIEECRVAGGEPWERRGMRDDMRGGNYGSGSGKKILIGDGIAKSSPSGRWPANLVLDEEAAAFLDAQSGMQRDGFHVGHNRNGGEIANRILGARKKDTRDVGYGQGGGASRFFYCAKASRKERDAGLEGMPQIVVQSVALGDRAYGVHPYTSAPIEIKPRPRANHHPTVKPIALMRWLVKLVARPGDVVLDPFMGSGTTGVACVEESRAFIGIEREAEYVEIARRRIEAADAQCRISV